jgi:trimeric autotransporter adhesin
LIVRINKNYTFMSTKKILSAVIALALVVSAIAPSTASAQTAAELQAQISALMAQIAAMNSTTVSSTAYVFTRDLTLGSVGVDVMNLQKVLNMSADTQVAVTGAGSPGMETSTFGPATKAAVIRFQNKYAAATLTPAGLTSGTGYVGALTRAKLNSMSAPSTTTTTTTTTTTNNLPAGCVAGAMFSATTGLSCTTTTTTTTTSGLNGGAGDITTTRTSADTESEVIEGDSDTPVIGIRVEANDSDVELKNIKVSFENQDGDSSARFTRYADEVTVWLDGKQVGSVDAADLNKDGDVYSGSISLSGAVVREDDRADLLVAVSAVSNIDSNDIDTNDFDVTVDQIRFTDATGAILTDLTDESENFNFSDLAASGDVTLKVNKGTDSPEAQSVEVSDSSSSQVHLLDFKLKAEGSEMTFDTVTVNIDANASKRIDAIADELILKVGSKTIETTDATTSSVTGGDVDFDLSDDYTIDQDDTVTFSVFAKVKKIEDASATVTVFGQGDTLTLNYVSVNAEDMNGDEVTDVSGSANGEAQTFYSEGVNASNFDSTVKETADDNGDFTKQTYSVSFDVTAFGNTYYIPKSVVRGSPTAEGLSYTVESSSGSTATSGAVASAASSLSSSASTVGGYYEVADGETETFTVKITLSSGTTAGFYRIQLGSVGYDTDQSGTPEYYTFAPAQDYESEQAELN